MALIEEYKVNRKVMNRCSCDVCGSEYVQRLVDTKHRRLGATAKGRDLCFGCCAKEAGDNFAKRGTAALARLPKDRRSEIGKQGGLAGAKSPNSGRFTKEFWADKSEEEKRFYGKRASNGLQKKLKDPEYAAQHFAKIFAQTAIGYQSKGHTDLHNEIESLGFKSHVQVGAVNVDEYNEKLKIVVEYNGDMWHCNPKDWKADQYNSAIKMTAGEKWKKDHSRYAFFKKGGNRFVVIWESEWLSNREECLNRIRKVYYEALKENQDSS